VLFAFLLGVPFAHGWDARHRAAAGRFLRGLLATAAPRILLIAPVVSPAALARGRQGANARDVQPARDRRQAFLALGMTAVVFHDSRDILFKASWAALTTALIAGGFAWFLVRAAALARGYDDRG